MKRRAIGGFVALAWGVGVVADAGPANTGIVVYRVGDGASALSSAATPVFLEKRALNGALLETIPLPTVAGTYPQSHALTAAGTSSSEGLLTRSVDGQYIVLGGYNAAPGTAAVSGTTGTTISRVVGLVRYDGAVDTTTALPDWASGSNPRGAASTDGTSLWLGGGAGGVRYVTLGASSSVQLSATVANVRGVAIYGDQLYASTGSGSFRITTVGIGLATMAGQTMNNLPGVPTTGTSPYQFVLLDLSTNAPGVDTLYVADDQSSSAGIQKYSLAGDTWVWDGNIQTGTTYRGLTGFASGSAARLYATTASATSLVKIDDPYGYDSGTTGVTVHVVATAPSNTAFRGVALAAVSPLTGYEAYANQIANPAKRGVHDDPDGDGYPNLLEYVTGGNPLVVDSLARMYGTCSGGVCGLVFSRNTAAADATLIVQASPTLTPTPTWNGIATNCGGLWSGAATVTESGTSSPVSVTVRDVDNSTTSLFLRLSVTWP